MKKNKKISAIFIIFILTIFVGKPVYPYSIRHHLINMGKNLATSVTSPFYGIFIKGPRNIKEAYEYEVWGREKSEKRGLLKYKLFTLRRAPGEEIKGLIDGVVISVKSTGLFLKELVSIFFSD